MAKLDIKTPSFNREDPWETVRQLTRWAMEIQEQADFQITQLEKRLIAAETALGLDMR